jgi:hypothetical protein
MLFGETITTSSDDHREHNTCGHSQSQQILLLHGKRRFIIAISGFRCGVERSALFWGVTQRRVVILYRCFGAIYQSHLQEVRSLRLLDP